jgi:hypothetical protein
MTSTIFYTTAYFWKTENPFLESSVSDLCNRIENCQETYEALKADTRSLYFDIDCYTSKIKKQDAQIIEQKGLEYITSFLKASNFDTDKYAIATSHGTAIHNDEIVKKYSIRYWFPNIKAHRNSILQFVKELNKWVKSSAKCSSSGYTNDHLYEFVGELFETKEKDVFKNLFDESIYDTNRKMRCLGTSKPGEDRPLVLKHGEIIDTIISNIREDQVFMEGKSPEENGVKVSSENEHIQKYCDYVSIIDKSKFTEYMDWFKFQRASANLLIPFDIYDKFMIGCEGYNKEKNRETYEKPHNDKKTKLGWKFIFDLAYECNPEKKSDFDVKWGKDLFCKYKFQKICNKYNPDKDNEEKTKLKEIQKEMKTYFEKYHFKVMSPYSFGRKTEVNGIVGYDFITRDTLHALYENLWCGPVYEKQFTKIWTSDFYIQQFENYDFQPPPGNISSSTFNLFTGFIHERLLPIELSADEIQENSKIFIKHLWYLAGKNNDVLEYVLDYLAHMLQEPGELPRTSIVFKSEQGVGKNLFFENFAEKILGPKYLLSTTNIDHILGRFPMISQKMLVLMDEANGKDSFLANDKIKGFITAPKIPYEKKGIDPVDIKNCARMIFFTNNDFPVKIEQSDRRFVVSECSSDVKNNTAYFKTLLNAFNDKKLIWSFAQFLSNRNIAEWDPVNDRPITKIYKQIQKATVPSDMRFFLDYSRFIYGENETPYTGKDLYEFYTMFCKCLPKQMTPITEMTFLKRLKEYPFLKKTKGVNKNTYEIVKKDHEEYITKNTEGAEEEDITDDFIY